MVFGLFFRHHLYVHCPLGEVAFNYRFIQITSRTLSVGCANVCRFFVGKVLDSLLSAEVELHPNTLVLSVVHRECVFSEEVHMTETVGYSTVAHYYRRLVESFG